MIRKMKKGFTIVELVIVIAVIAVLTAILVPTFISISNKADKASDQSLVKNLNTALKIVENDPKIDPNGKNNILHDAVEDLAAYGYDLPKLVTKSDEKMVWSSETNQFYLESDATSFAKIDLWRIQDNADATDGYSIYAGENFVEPDGGVEVSVGFDAGYHALKKVKYVNSGEAQRVSIRTNSLETTLSIVAPNDHVTRYGKAGVVEPLITADSSFEDNGSSPWVTLTSGRFVVTPKTNVDKLFLNVDKENPSVGLAITLEAGAEMPEIVRPALDLEDGETVKIVEVTTNSTTETLYLRGDSTIEDNNVLSSTDGGQTKTPVTADTASETAIAIANNKVGGEVVEKGLDEDQKADAVVDAKTAAEVDEMAEETGEDLTNYEARIGYKGYTSFKSALDAAKEGETISLMKDVVLTASTLYSSNRLWILKNITIDGCNHSARVASNGFGICTENVTFKNITITNTAAAARCIDIRNGQSGIGKFVEEVNLDHVTLSTNGSSSVDQPLTVGGNSTNFKDASGKVRKTKINISNHSLIKTKDDATAYYAIITFNPIELNVKDSQLRGWANVYFKGASSSYGSKGSVVNIDGCELYTKNIYNGSSNAFSMIMLEDGTSTEKIIINVKNSELHVDASSDQYQSVLATNSSSRYYQLNLLEGNKLYFNDSDCALFAYNLAKGQFSIANGTEIYSPRIDATDVASFLANNQQLRDDGEGKYTVVAK